MKKAIIVLALAACLALALNFEVSTKQGINYKVRVLKIPLYLKILDFYDRHYNYKHLAGAIIKGAKSPEDKATRILEWTYGNIRSMPAGLPVVDDHVWHIIVRGYGVSDQINDVFCTLCNYAGLDAFFSWVRVKDKKEAAVFSFVKIKDKWYIFEASNGTYFVDNSGKLADIGSLKIKAGKWQSRSISGDNMPDYSGYLENLPLIKEMDMKRSNIQSPFRRLLYEFRRKLGLIR